MKDLILAPINQTRNLLDRYILKRSTLDNSSLLFCIEPMQTPLQVTKAAKRGKFGLSITAFILPAALLLLNLP